MSSLYKTKPGDTIEKIIEKYHSSYEDFIKLNDVKNLVLLEKQTIFIPLTYDKRIKLHQHETISGETLNKLIKQYNTKYEEIDYFNNLSRLYLKEGQIVKIEPKLLSPVLDEF